MSDQEASNIELRMPRLVKLERIAVLARAAIDGGQFAPLREALDAYEATYGEAEESEGQASLSRLGEFAEKHRGGTITLQADELSELVALAEQAEALREAGQELRGYVRAQLHGHDATVELAYAAEKWDEALREAQESEGREG